MIARRCRILVSLLAVLLLAAVGVASASKMAPTQDDIAHIQIAALGQTPDAICGDLSVEEHHCPICHIDPQPPAAGPMKLWRQFVPSAAWQQQRDLHRRAQARDHSRTSRAPPERS